MKKSSLMALVLALCFTAPSVMLIACREELTEAPNSSFIESVEGSLEEETSESSSSTSQESVPPESAPSTSEQPDTPPPQEEVAPSPAPTIEKARYIQCTGDNVNIRSGAGSDYPAVGTLNYGDRVTILEDKKVGDTTWGKTSKGWISLDYVSLD